MQTIGKFSVPRNRTGYEISNLPTLSAVAPGWDAFNRAEYHVWCALKLGYRTGILNSAARESHKAMARYYLSLSAAR